MEIKEGINLRGFTTFEIGGDAKYYAEAWSGDDVVSAIAWAKDHEQPYEILAGGSNVLVSDDGYDGVIIHIKMDKVSIDEQRITIDAGADLMDLLTIAAQRGLAGLESLAGVPGSVGGAVRGNAGAFGTEIGDRLVSVEVYDTVDESYEELDRSACRYGYRSSIFKELSKRYIILRASFDFDLGDKEQIEDYMHDIVAQRNRKHIQNIKSAGSFFMNPVVSRAVQQDFERDKEVESKDGRVPAGWLLQSVGLDQKRIGDIQAGEMHANYFINQGKGTAGEVLQLASMAKMRVRDTYDVQLKEEVSLIGFEL